MITAMDGESIKQNIFTNIDSAVIVIDEAGLPVI